MKSVMTARRRTDSVAATARLQFNQRVPAAVQRDGTPTAPPQRKKEHHGCTRALRAGSEPSGGSARDRQRDRHRRLPPPAQGRPDQRDPRRTSLRGLRRRRRGARTGATRTGAQDASLPSLQPPPRRPRSRAPTSTSARAGATATHPRHGAAGVAAARAAVAPPPLRSHARRTRTRPPTATAAPPRAL